MLKKSDNAIPHDHDDTKLVITGGMIALGAVCMAIGCQVGWLLGTLIWGA